MANRVDALTEPEWMSRTDGRLTSIEQRLGHLETNDAVAGVNSANIEKRLASIEGTLIWLVRLVIGALLMALLGFALRGGLPL